MAKWLGKSWEDFTKNNQKMITNAFKKCDMYNALNGSESHLINLRKYSAYKARKKEDKLANENKNICRHQKCLFFKFLN